MGGGLFGSAGGGGLCVIGNFSKANISNSIISNTTSESESGALFTCNDGRITASNCLIVNNFYYGVSNGCNSGAPGAIELINCTVTNNNEGLY